ncbi:ABC transporter permease [Cohnella caldifontis]|uniref:ABC transporter permease n=1 Tax=Cohnella caldifontis TaxID=3027471 RepID=UPI0023EACA03|nr:ABC transporter permease [Cohnella sp. YIM B05605]
MRQETALTRWIGRERIARGRKPSAARRGGTQRLLLYGAAAVVIYFLACAIVPQWLAPFPPMEMRMDRSLLPPGPSHWFGTDYYGRDLYSVVVYGSRQSLLVGIASVLAGGLSGALLGAVSGYAGGLVDAVIMRAVDVLMTVPGLLLALAVAAALGPGRWNIVLAVAVASVPGYARVMRGQILSVKVRPYVRASASIGASPSRVFWTHVLPNSLSPLYVMSTLGIGASILAGSGLSFLGLGDWNASPDWGAILSQGRGYMTVAWWISAFPGFAITAFVLSVNLYGDWLRDFLDPKKNARGK